MKEIKLTQNQVTLVDDDMYEELSQHKWCAFKFGKAFYAGRHSVGTDGKRRNGFMHHVVTGFPPKGLMSDHINGNSLDNQKKNLRFVNSRGNNQNRKRVYRSSQYPGVNWQKRDKKWQARIWANDKRKHLGYFTSEFAAFLAYRTAVEAIGERVIGL